jgi:hypothetical protein
VNTNYTHFVKINLEFYNLAILLAQLETALGDAKARAVIIDL